MHVLLLIIALLAPCSFSLDVLMYVNVIGKSHLQFAEKLIEVLAENGHTVDVIMGVLNSYVPVKLPHGVRRMVRVDFPGGVSPWGAAEHLTNPFEERSDWDRIFPEPTKFIDTTEKLCDLIIDSREVVQLLSSNQYDIALISGYDLCPFALAHQYKISPVVSFVPTAAYYTQLYAAGIPELPLYENMMFDARHADRANFATRVFETLRMFKERYIRDQTCNVFNDKFRARFGEDFTDVQQIAMNISLDFINSHPLLEEPKPISLRLKYIGGIGLPKPKKLTKDINDLLNVPTKGNVIFSFGTQIEPDKFSEDLQKVFVNTFKRFQEYNFMWKFDGTTKFNSSNVINMNWLPQTDMLLVAFISHMGLNSFIETSFAGVPVVAIPVFTDQVHNAKRAVSIGTGEIVRKSEITEESLTRALEKVLFDERYRQRAKEVATMISGLPDTPQRVFLEAIEYVAKHKHLSKHFRLAGANHNFLVQIGWDVAAFLTIILVVLAGVIIKLSIAFIRKLSELLIVKRKVD